MLIISFNPAAAEQKAPSRAGLAKRSSLLMIYWAARTHVEGDLPFWFQVSSRGIISTVLAARVPNCSNCILWFHFHFLYYACISRRPLLGLNYLPCNLCFCFQLVFTAESCQKSHILNTAVGHTLKPHEFPGFLAARHKLLITLGQSLPSYGMWSKFTDISENAPVCIIH